jgi:hypothetical protein
MKTSQVDFNTLIDLISDKRESIYHTGVENIEIRIQGCQVDNDKNTLWVNFTYLCRNIWVMDDCGIKFSDYIQYSRNRKIGNIL